MNNIQITNEVVNIFIDEEFKTSGNYNFKLDKDHFEFKFIDELNPIFKEDKKYKSGQNYLDSFRIGIDNCKNKLINNGKSVELVASLKDNYKLDDLKKERCFCEFRLNTKITGSGVYLWVVDNKIIYVGEALNLKSRFNSGYGHISPRNIFKNGQSTNCKMNLVVSEYLKNNKKVNIYFLDTTQLDKSNQKTQREMIEKYLVNYIGLDKLLNEQK